MKKIKVHYILSKYIHNCEIIVMYVVDEDNTNMSNSYEHY